MYRMELDSFEIHQCCECNGHALWGGGGSSHHLAHKGVVPILTQKDGQSTVSHEHGHICGLCVQE